MHQDDRALLEAENQAERLAYLGTAACATSHRATDLTWVVTGVPAADHNGVFWTRLSTADADTQVPALAQQFQDQGLPATWQVDPASEPRDLGGRLRTLGCPLRAATSTMVAQLDNLAHEVARFPGLTISRVTTADELADWIDVCLVCQSEDRAVREALYLSLGLGGRQPLQHYLARLDGQPVGGSQLFLGQRAAGLYCLDVPPAFRGRGIGTALALTPLLVARTLGYDRGVVRPRARSQMYSHLGFEPVTSAAAEYAIGPDNADD